MRRSLFWSCLLVLALWGCRPEDGPGEPSSPEDIPPGSLSIGFTGVWEDLAPKESRQLKCEISGEGYDPEKRYDIVYSSSNTAVVRVSPTGVATAVAPGAAVLRAVVHGSDAFVEKTCYVVDLHQLTQPYSPDRVFEKGHTIYARSVMQSWDFFGDWMYVIQIVGAEHAISVTRKPVLGQSPQAYMQLKYFGHGDNMFVERCEDGDYLWISNYGTQEASDKTRYTDSQALSRVKFTSDATLVPGDCTDNYVYPGMKRMIAAYDRENGTVAIWCRDGSGKAWIYVYDLETLKAAPSTAITLKYSITYGNPAVTETPVVQARDLSALTPVLSFKMPFNGVPQGYDWHGNKLYVFQGDGAEAAEVAAGTNRNWARAHLINTRGETLFTVDVPWVDDLALLKDEGITDLGYFEPEGLKIKDGAVYLGFASKDAGSSPARRVNLFRYPLD